MAGVYDPMTVDNTLGAAFLGHSVETALFGVTTVQCILYYRRHADDALKLKSLVSKLPGSVYAHALISLRLAQIGLLWFMDALHLALTTHAVYFYCISNYNNPSALQSPVWYVVSHHLKCPSTHCRVTRFD
jgi:hypothetical protein